MIVRKLRVTTGVQRQAPFDGGIDAIENPVMLAHRLMTLDSASSVLKADNRLRMSKMHDVCVRAQLLAFRNNYSQTEYTPVNLRVTFDIGNALHLFFQNSDDYLGKNRLGWWRCLACGTKIFGRKPKQPCKCGASHEAIVYHEHALRLSKEHPVSGHIDCFLEVAPGDIRVLDFKTINGEDFEALSAPKADHCIQINGYMKYIQFDNTIPVRINPNKGLVLYISKKHSAKSLPFKIFHVNKEKMFTDVIEEKVAAFKRGLEDHSFLPAPLEACVAARFESYKCRSCIAYKFCVEEKNGR